MSGAARIAALTVYPVKALQGIPTEVARVTPKGLALETGGAPVHDRQWMIVDGEGRFLTRREHPSLARLRVDLEGDGVRLQAEGVGRLRLDPAPDGPRRQVAVWRHRGEAVDGGEAAARWISGFLGRPARLVWLPDDVVRPVNPRHGRPGDAVRFADGYPLLLANAASLDDLSARRGAPVDPRRLRPSAVIAGPAAWDEDGWAQVALGAARLRVAKPCDRCVVVNVDPDTGEKGTEPLRTLAGFRRVGEKVNFGVLAIPDGEAVVRVGDAVGIVARG